MLFTSTLILESVNGQGLFLSKAGGQGNDESLASVRDRNGNIYSTGYFDVSATFGSIQLTSNGQADVFISRQDSTGNYLWAINAGGGGADRAYSIAISGKGNISICGFFTGTFTAGSITLTSVGSLPDMFVATVDSNGQFISAFSFGGNDIEIPNSITYDADDNLLITGQFRDTAYFGSVVAVSESDPMTLLPSYDLFIVKADSIGNVKWLKHGKAKYDDRGLRIRVDSDGYIYVTGQFSDSLRIDNLYANNAFNAGFLLKLDSAGNEIWFRKMLASQVMTYDLAVSNDAIWMCGDFLGTLIYQGGIPHPGTIDANNIFLARIDTSGDLVGVYSSYSYNSLTARAISVDSSGNAYLAGMFSCVHTDYSSFYGTGIFNSAGFQDVFIAKIDTGMNDSWQRHIGGPGVDIVTSMFLNGADEPVISGSFERHINMPATSFVYLNSANYNSSHLGAFQPAGFCGDANYGSYISTDASGNKDVFSSMPVDLSRLPYDYYERMNPCQRDSLLPMINLGADTIAGCDSIALVVNTRTGTDGMLGPDFEFVWSNGKTDQGVYALQTGLYMVTVTNADNCRVYADSVYIIIYPEPADPLITYDKGYGQQAIPENNCFQKLIVILPDITILTGSNLTPGYSYHWETPWGIEYGDSVSAVSAGVYTFNVTTPDGNCLKSTCIEVVILNRSLGIPGSTDFGIHFGDSLAEVTDTLRICEGNLFKVFLAENPPWANDTLTILPTFVRWVITGGFSYHRPHSYHYTFIDHRQEFVADSTSSCTVSCIIEDPADGTPILTISRNFYLYIYPAPPLNLQIAAPIWLCPSDTVLLTVTGGDNYHCWGPGIVHASSSNDTILFVNEGTYYASAFVIDSVTGCMATDTISHDVLLKEAPPVQLIPESGIICPVDSVMLMAPPGSDYSWYGPLGSIIANTQIIYSSVPGFYYYSYKDTTGCSLVSDFAEIIQYSTPDLIATPSEILCNESNVTIVLQSSDPQNVQWQPPLSGNALSVVVNQPGTYSCNVTSCGIVTTVSITISSSNTVALISVQGDTVCSNEQVLLSAPSGMLSYQWLPSNESSPVIQTTGGGHHTLIVAGPDGCNDTSSVSIAELPAPEPPLVDPNTICAGDSIMLQSSATGNVSWHNDTLQSALSTSATFQTGVLNSDTVFYAVNSDSVCTSYATVVPITMHQSSLLPQIDGDTILCLHDTLSLSTTIIPGGVYSWTGINGFTSVHPAISFPVFDSLLAGLYTLQVMDSFCISPINSVAVSLAPDPSVTITSNYLGFCAGSYVNVFALQSLAGYFWLPGGQTTSSIQVDEGGDYFLIGTDSNGCKDTSQMLSIIEFTLPPAPLINDTNVCEGDTLILTAFSTGTVHWSTGDTGYSIITGALFKDTAFLVHQVDSNGCESNQDTVQTNVQDLPPAPLISGRDSVCINEALNLSATATAGSSFYWTGPGGFINNTSQLIIDSVQEIHSGVYISSVELNGCSASTELHVVILLIPDDSVDNNSPLCEGESIVLNQVAYPEVQYSWSGPGTFSSVMPTVIIPDAGSINSGYYYYEMEWRGCRKLDSVLVVIEQFPSIDLGSDVEACFGAEVQLLIVPGFDSYSWSTGETNNTITALTEGLYWVEVRNGNCASRDSVSITDIDCSINIPNIFTPNADGINDLFYIAYANARKNDLFIYNRWGEEVAALNSLEGGWDGSSKNNRSLPEGTYYFKAHIIDYFMKPHVITGSLYLSR